MRAELFAPKPLRDALLKAGVEDIPTERQVRRWVSGDTPMPTRIQTAIRRLLDMPETQKEAAPDLPERLDKIERYLRVMARGLPVPAAVLAEIEAAHHDVSGGAHEPPPPGATRRKGGRRPRGK